MRPYFFLIISAGALLAYLGAIGDPAPDESARLAFSIRAEAYAMALSHARANGLSFDMGRQAASILADNDRAGTNIPNGRLLFDQTGACRTGNGGSCAGREITIASDVQRIYTITFDDTGKPALEYDDFETE